MINTSLPILAMLIVCNVFGLATAGELDPSQQEWFARYKRQENTPEPTAMLLNKDEEPDLTVGFVPLFDGKNLHNWTRKGGTSHFEAKDGLLVGTCDRNSPSTYLCTNTSDFSDFLFTCEMKWEVDCNSGIMFRSQSRPGDGDLEIVYGPQVEMEGFSKDRQWSGGIYGQSCGGYYYPLWLKEHKSARDATKEGEWNRVTVLAQGKDVRTWINGVPAAYWIDERDRHPEGFFALQIHKGVKGTVLWRNIRVKQIND